MNKKLTIIIVSVVSTLLSGVLIFLAIFFGLKKKGSDLLSEEITELKNQNEELIKEFNDIKSFIEKDKKSKKFKVDFYSSEGKKKFQKDKEDVFKLIKNFNITKFNISSSNECQNQNLTAEKLCIEEFNKNINDTIENFKKFNDSYYQDFKNFNKTLEELRKFPGYFINNLSLIANNTIDSLISCNQILNTTFFEKKGSFYTQTNKTIFSKSNQCNNTVNLYSKSECFKNLKTGLEKINDSFVKLNDTFNFDHKQFDKVFKEFEIKKNKFGNDFQFLFDFYSSLNETEVQEAQTNKHIIKFLPFLKTINETTKDLISDYVTKHDQKKNVSVKDLYQLNSKFNNQTKEFLEKKKESELTVMILLSKLLEQQFEQLYPKADLKILVSELNKIIKPKFLENEEKNIKEILEELKKFFECQEKLYLDLKKNKKSDYSREQQKQLQEIKTKIYSKYLALSDEIKDEMSSIISQDEFVATFNPNLEEVKQKKQQSLMLSFFSISNGEIKENEENKKKLTESINFLNKKLGEIGVSKKLKSSYERIVVKAPSLKLIIETESKLKLLTIEKKDVLLKHISSGTEDLFTKIDQSFEKVVSVYKVINLFHNSNIYYNGYYEKIKNMSEFHSTIDNDEIEIYKNKKTDGYYNFFYSLQHVDNDNIYQDSEKFNSLLRANYDKYATNNTDKLIISQLYSYCYKKYNLIYRALVRMNKYDEKYEFLLKNKYSKLSLIDQKTYREYSSEIEKFVLDKLTKGTNKFAYFDFGNKKQSILLIILTIVGLFLNKKFVFFNLASLITLNLNILTSRQINLNSLKSYEINDHKYQFLDLMNADNDANSVNKNNLEQFKEQENDVQLSSVSELLIYFNIISSRGFITKWVVETFAMYTICTLVDGLSIYFIIKDRIEKNNLYYLNLLK